MSAEKLQEFYRSQREKKRRERIAMMAATVAAGAVTELGVHTPSKIARHSIDIALAILERTEAEDAEDE